MQMIVRFRNVQSSPALMEHVRRKANSAMGRFSNRIRRVTVRVEDVNGPKGGVDKKCSVTVSGASLDTQITHFHDDVYAAIAAALERAGASVRKRVAAHRTRGRQTRRLERAMATG